MLTGHARRRFTGLTPIIVLVSACSTTPEIRDAAPSHAPDVSGIPDATPRAEPLSKYGNPASYEVGGRRYFTLASASGYVERGQASWYGTKFHGKRTSSGEPYDMYAMTAAHRTLPLPTYAEVVNLENGRRAVVKINDRGPFHGNRIIDLSYAAAVKLGITARGTGQVEVRAIDAAGKQAGATDGRSPLFIQVGAYRNRDNAERVRQRLATTAVGGDVEIVRGGEDNADIYRVRIGPVTGTAAAERLTQTLTSLGIDHPTIVTE